MAHRELNLRERRATLTVASRLRRIEWQHHVSQLILEKEAAL